MGDIPKSNGTETGGLFRGDIVKRYLPGDSDQAGP